MGNYSPLAIFTKEPVAIASAIKSVLWILVLLGVVNLVDEQLAALALGLELVLGLFQRANVTPTASPTLEMGTRVTVAGTNDQPPPDAAVLPIDRMGP